MLHAQLDPCRLRFLHPYLVRAPGRRLAAGQVEHGDLPPLLHQLRQQPAARDLQIIRVRRDGQDVSRMRRLVRDHDELSMKKTLFWFAGSAWEPTLCKAPPCASMPSMIRTRA